MPKCFASIVQYKVRSVVVCLLCVVSIVHLLFYCGEYNYSWVPISQIHSFLYKAANPQLVHKKSLNDCNYDFINSSYEIKSTEIWTKFDNFSAKGINNGMFDPEQCNALYSVALLVPYRNRQYQLDIFIPYIHNFLRKQNVNYRVYVIEQQDEKAWNKGLLYNVGAKAAILDKYPCLILHDVDLLPMNSANLYACLHEPRHMSASIDKFRFVLPYNWLIGGVTAIQATQYVQVNGFSNKYIQWGGEDDDFAMRLTAQNLKILRLPREYSQYKMLVHHQEHKNADRAALLEDSLARYEKDGLNSIRYESIQIKQHRLFTLIGVRS